MLKTLCLGWTTNSLNIVLALRGAGIETVIVNTGTDRFFDKVPILCHNILVALNLYRESKIPKPKYFRYLFTAHPYIFGFPLRQKLAFLLRSYDINFVFAHWSTGVLPEVVLVKFIFPNLPVILNMGTFPTDPSGRLPGTIEFGLLKKMARAIDVTSFMTQFDACLVSYNVNSGSPLRFKTSLPYRFLIALAAGIPIILSSRRFEAMENFIKRESIGIAYRSTEELLHFIISDHKWIELRETCCFKQNRFLLDAKELLCFVNNVLNKSGVKKHEDITINS